MKDNGRSLARIEGSCRFWPSEDRLMARIKGATMEIGWLFPDQPITIVIARFEFQIQVQVQVQVQVQIQVQMTSREGTWHTIMSA
jgi:hypothetical protein